jgi:hypothetical protein
MKGNDMNTPYKILKLRSGEEIIAKISGQTKDKMILERPMIFMTKFIIDPYSGKQRELTTLKNWLSNTNEIQTKIPKDYVATFLTPDKEVLELYSMEMEREDVNTQVRQKFQNLTPEDAKKMIDLENEDLDIPDDKFEQIMDMLKDSMNENPNMIDDMIPTFEDEEDEEKTNLRNFITLTMFIPPEALLPMVKAGMIDMKDIKNLIQSLSNDNYFGEDKERQKDEDFGNDWTDWSPDITDYFK